MRKTQKKQGRYRPLNVYPSTKTVIETYSAENMNLVQTKCADILIKTGYEAIKKGFPPVVQPNTI